MHAEIQMHAELGVGVPFFQMHAEIQMHAELDVGESEEKPEPITLIHDSISFTDASFIVRCTAQVCRYSR